MADNVAAPEALGLRTLDIPKSFEAPKADAAKVSSLGGRLCWMGSIWNPICAGAIDCGLAFPAWTNMGPYNRVNQMQAVQVPMGCGPTDSDALPGIVTRVTQEQYDRMVHQLDRVYYRLHGLGELQRLQIDLGVWEEVQMARRIIKARKPGESIGNVDFPTKDLKERTLLINMRMMSEHEIHRVALREAPAIVETGEMPDIPAGALLWFQWLDELEGKDEEYIKRYRPAGYTMLPCKPPLLRKPTEDQRRWYNTLCDKLEKAFKRGVPVQALHDADAESLDEYFSETVEGKNELPLQYVRL